MPLFDKKSSNYMKIAGRKLAKMDQPVTISDIILVQEAAPLSHYLPLERDHLFSHIQMLGNVANHYHSQKNFIGEQMDPKKKNAVTRLILNEFSLYPKKEPLSIQQLGGLIRKIETHAKTLHENLILVLATLPVEMPDGYVANLLLHVQCGPDAKIDTIIKVNPHRSDATFKGHENLRYDPQDKPRDTAAMTLLHKHGEPAVNYNRIISCQTAGGALFFSALDICLDHYKGEAKKSFAQLIEVEASNETHAMLPGQISQVVTAKSCHLHEEQLLTPKEEVAHADPAFMRADYPHSLPTEIKKTADYIKTTYPHIPIKLEKNHLIIAAPIFGEMLHLFVAPDKALSRVPSEFRHMIDDHNMKSIDHYVFQHLAKSIHDDFMQKASAQFKDIIQQHPKEVAAYLLTLFSDGKYLKFLRLSPLNEEQEKECQDTLWRDFITSLSMTDFLFRLKKFIKQELKRIPARPSLEETKHSRLAALYAATKDLKQSFICLPLNKKREALTALIKHVDIIAHYSEIFSFMTATSESNWMAFKKEHANLIFTINPQLHPLNELKKEAAMPYVDYVHQLRLFSPNKENA